MGLRRCDGDLLYIPIGLLHQSTMMQVPNDMSNLGMRSRAHMLPDRQLTQLTRTHSYCKGRVLSLGVACRCGKLKFELDMYGARTIMLMVNGPYASGYDRIIFARTARLPFQPGYPELGSTVRAEAGRRPVYSVDRVAANCPFRLATAPSGNARPRGPSPLSPRHINITLPVALPVAPLQVSSTSLPPLAEACAAVGSPCRVVTTRSDLDLPTAQATGTGKLRQSLWTPTPPTPQS